MGILQVELATLESTVAQLERQKIEAGKRLDALDNQIAQLERNEAQLKEKLKDEESRLAALREENRRNTENAAVLYYFLCIFAHLAKCFTVL